MRSINEKIDSYTKEITTLTESIKSLEAEQLNLNEHIAVVKKLDTFAKLCEVLDISADEILGLKK